MKRTFTLIALISAFVSASTQNVPIEIGVEISAISNSLKNDAVIFDFKPGYIFSPKINLRYHIKPKLQLKTALGYENRGIKTDAEFRVAPTWITQNLSLQMSFDYIKLPVMVSYFIGHDIKLYISGGFFLGYLYNQDLYLGGFGDYEDDINYGSDFMTDFDFGAMVETSLSYPVAKKLFIESGLRKDFGLVNLLSKRIFNVGSVHSGSWGIFVGLKYKL